MEHNDKRQDVERARQEEREKGGERRGGRERDTEREIFHLKTKETTET